MKLNNTICKNATSTEKPYKIADGGGLYLLVKPNGSKHWRVKYRFLGKEKLLALGPYPLVSLLEARDGREVAKKQLLAGTDPMSDKSGKKRQAMEAAHNTFRAVALEWHENQLGGWSKNHALNVMRRLDVDIFPYIGNKAITEITGPILLNDVIRRIEKRGALDIASRVHQIIGQICRYGIATGKGGRDHAADIRGALKTSKTKHYAALEIAQMPEFFAALSKNEARLYERTRRAIKLIMLTFVRTSELIKAKWSEFDLINAQWEIPAERMKTGNPHIVPLSKQVVKLLKEQKLDGRHGPDDYVLPSQVRPREHMSNNTILVAIGRLGFKGRMTGHGFRALAMSTLKENLGIRHEIVDRQLAHVHKSKIDRAYDRAKFLPERKKMMQLWADYISAVEIKDLETIKKLEGKYRGK
ncbi:MAG: integrase [Micavibrio aeruginosavorus]|uniref:Integrase n=1 Tax=Micavibrio aeruginosavorus TaxID=349221 RepID=A0A2W5FPZ4_9BACT|nr:MAG: integrase [Micavibrio aeruginosavorus]